MKHIKKFKNNNIVYKYDVGDYVLLKDDPKFCWTVYLEVQIIYVEKDFESEMPYTFLSVNKADNKILKLQYMEEETIERKLTPEEIENFKLLNDINKYNL